MKEEKRNSADNRDERPYRLNGSCFPRSLKLPELQFCDAMRFPKTIGVAEEAWSVGDKPQLLVLPAEATAGLSTRRISPFPRQGVVDELGRERLAQGLDALPPLTERVGAGLKGSARRA